MVATITATDSQALECHRLKVQAWIRKKVEGGRYAQDPNLAVYLATTALAMLAEKYPRKLDDEELKKVSSNYQDATPAKVAERAMTDEGVLAAANLGCALMCMAIDNSPSSYVADIADSDVAIFADGALMEEFLDQLTMMQERLRAAGVSEFGIRALIASNGVLKTQGIGEAPPLMQHLRLMAELAGSVLESS